MGIMYAMKCDLCGEVQVKENPTEIEGTTYTENNQTKFACSMCRSLLKAAIEIGKKGLRNPLAKVAGLIEQRDKAKRERDEAAAALGGTNPYAALIMDPKAVLKLGPQLGQPIPLANPPPQTGALPLADKPRRIGHDTSSRKKDHGKKG